MRTLGRAALAALLLISSAARAEVSVKQEVEPGPIGVGDPFQLTVSISGSEREVSADLPPGDYKVLGRSHATSMQMSSGPSGMQTKRTEEFIFTLAARRPGRLFIPGARVTADGMALAAEPTTQDVQRQHVARAQQSDDDDPLASMMQQMRRSGFSAPLMQRFFAGDPFANDPFAQPGSAPLLLQPGDVRLEASADRKSARPGEQITLSYYLTARVPVSGVNGLEMPAVSGAATRDIELGKRLVPEVQDGVARVLVARKALFASAAGPLQIASATAKVAVGDALSSQEISLSSPPIMVDIQPLPPGPANAAVGHWTLSLTGPERARAGEPLTLRVRARGVGDTSSLPVPALALPIGWKAFPPSTSETPAVIAGRVGGTRIWDFVAIPSGEGPAEIAPVSLSEFEPASARYVEVKSQPLALQIEAAAAPVATSAARPQEFPAQPTFASVWSGVAPPIAFAALLTLLATLAVFALLRRSGARSREPASPRAARLRDARHNLEAARELCDSEHAPAFFERLSKALRLLVESFGEEDPSAADPSRIAASLRHAGLAAPACDAVARALEACRRFAFLGTNDGAALLRTLTLADEAFSAIST